jgi:hypothetical protein
VVIQEHDGTAYGQNWEMDRIMAVLQLRYCASWYFGLATKDCLFQVKGARSVTSIGCDKD